MHNHQPKKYTCPFCQIIEGAQDSMAGSDVIYQDADVPAFLSLSRWEKNPFEVLIVPNRHIENLYDLPLELAPALQKATREVAVAFDTAGRGSPLATSYEPCALWRKPELSESLRLTRVRVPGGRSARSKSVANLGLRS